MNPLSFPFKFKDRDTGYALINALATLERTAPRRFFEVVEEIALAFDEMSGKIGNGTVMGIAWKRPSIEITDERRLLFSDIDQFMALRFKNRDLGEQIVVTLIEIEARNEKAFKRLYHIVTRASKECRRGR